MCIQKMQNIFVQIAKYLSLSDKTYFDRSALSIEWARALCEHHKILEKSHLLPSAASSRGEERQKASKTINR